MTPPYPQLWLRYSAFIPLYPLGVASELTMAYLAMPVIREKRPLTLTMPNALNWGFDYYVFCWLAIACYVPGRTCFQPLTILPRPPLETIEYRESCLAAHQSTDGCYIYVFAWMWPASQLRMNALLVAGLPFLYLYMLQQRQKLLGTPKIKKSKAL
jgi:hypothetical protein